jgi:hypothetical protein
VNGQRAFGGTLIASRQARPYHLTQAEIAADESASIIWHVLSDCNPSCNSRGEA